MRKFALLALLLGGLAPLGAHECWLQPSTFAPAAGDNVRLSLQIGMEFRGEARPFNPARVAALRHFSSSGVADWTGAVTAAPDFPAAFATPGTHVVTYDSQPSFIELDGEKFLEYLREEGLDHVVAERAKAGETARPGRERYQRCVKTIVQAGGQADASYAVVTGQRLELVPVEDPAALRPGAPLRVRVLFAGQPLAGAKVRAWHRQGDKLTTLDAHTEADGTAIFTLPLAGEWMFSTVRMARVTGDAKADWESHWGNLTFAIAP